jgi:F-type H+-transporting ATPase subunit b
MKTILRGGLLAAAFALLGPAPVALAQHGDEGQHEAAAHGEGEHGEAAHGEGEHGGGHHAEAFDPVEFLATVINFVIWIALLVWLFRRPTVEFLNTRRLAVEEGLVEAKALQEEAERKFAEYTERLENLDEELDRMREDMLDAGKAERDRIVADAEAKAARMRRDTEFIVEQQLKQIRIDLTKEAVEGAVKMAEELLKERTSGDDQTRLADEYLTALAENLKANPLEEAEA